MTVTADQKLLRMCRLRSLTAKEGIQRVQAMHEPSREQELKRTIDGGWCRLLMLLRNFRENVVGAYGLVLTPDDFQDAPSLRSQFKGLGLADLLGGSECPAHTPGMIMSSIARFESHRGGVHIPKARFTSPYHTPSLL